MKSTVIKVSAIVEWTNTFTLKTIINYNQIQVTLTITQSLLPTLYDVIIFW